MPWFGERKRDDERSHIADALAYSLTAQLRPLTLTEASLRARSPMDLPIRYNHDRLSWETPEGEIANDILVQANRLGLDLWSPMVRRALVANTMADGKSERVSQDASAPPAPSAALVVQPWEDQNMLGQIHREREEHQAKWDVEKWPTRNFATHLASTQMWVRPQPPGW